MSVIHRDIYIIQNQYVRPIEIVQDSQVGIELKLMDYTIPEGAYAKAYARGKFVPDTYVTDCAVTGDTVYFIPPNGFFVPGPNRLQIEINGVIIPFSIDVNCESRVSDAGGPATPEQVIPLVERAEAAASSAEKAASKAAQEANAAVTPLVNRAETAASAAEQSQKAVEEIEAELKENNAMIPELNTEINGLKNDLMRLDVYDLKMVKDYVGCYDIKTYPDITYQYTGGLWKFFDTVLDASYTGPVTVKIETVDLPVGGNYAFYDSSKQTLYQPIGEPTAVFPGPGEFRINAVNGLLITLQASRGTAQAAQGCVVGGITAVYGESPEGKQGLPDYFVGTEQLKEDVAILTDKVNSLPIVPHEQTKHDANVAAFEDCISSAKEQIVSATATFEALSKFSVGLTKASDYSASANLVAYVDVDGENVTLHYSLYGSPRTIADAHGLDVSGMVGVKMFFNWTNSLTVLVTTTSGTFERTYSAPYVRLGKCYPFHSLNATNGRVIGFSNVFPKINKKVWLFGDSYFADVPERWVYYVDRSKCFFNGYPGEASTNALAELEYLLTIGKPKYVVWCLGMNDTNATTWNNAFARLKVLSKQCGFELVMGVTPTVPTRLNNEEYRAAILASGLRYIDFYAAVGAGPTGEWFPGLISDDGVHPSVLGGKVLASQVYADFPEIAID